MQSDSQTRTAGSRRIAFSNLASCLVILATAGTGCSSYRTPERGANMSVFTDSDIEAVLARKPAAAFPANIAVARVQSPGYRSYTAKGHGKGRYSVVTVRDIETKPDFDRIANLSNVADVVPLNRLLLGNQLDSDKPLRQAAAALHADMLMLYTIDTAFFVQDPASPLTVITIGLSPHKDVRVTTTASFVVIDVRTGYVYGAGESTVQKKRFASAWTDQDTVDRARLATEREAFESMFDEFETLWGKIPRSGQIRSTASMDN